MNSKSKMRVNEALIFFKIMELVYDTKVEIKLAAIGLAFQILDILTKECKMNRMTNLFVEMLHSTNEEVLKLMSFIMGNIIFSVPLC